MASASTPTSFSDAQPRAALDRLLGDTALRGSLVARDAALIQRRDGVRKDADLIEAAAG